MNPGDFESLVDVGANVVVADIFREFVLLKDLTDRRVDTREDNRDAGAVALLYKVREVVDSRRVYKRYLAHTDNPDARLILHPGHYIVEFACNAEEIRTVNLIYLNSVWNVEMLKVEVVELTVLIRVDFLCQHAHLGGLCHAAHAEEASHDNAHLDSDGEVEDDGEDERKAQNSHVALGVAQHLENGAPSAHVVAHHHKNTRQTCHGNI